MDDRKRSLAAVTIVIGFLVLLVVFVGSLVSRKGVVSPVPEEGAIKIIFITPTPTTAPTEATVATPSPLPKATKQPKPTATPTP